MTATLWQIIGGAVLGVVLGWIETSSYGWARGSGRDPASTSRDAE